MPTPQPFEVTEYGRDAIVFDCQMEFAEFNYARQQKFIELHERGAIGDYPINVRVVITVEDEEDVNRVARDYERYEET